MGFCALALLASQVLLWAKHILPQLATKRQLRAHFAGVSLLVTLLSERS